MPSGVLVKISRSIVVGFGDMGPAYTPTTPVVQDKSVLQELTLAIEGRTKENAGELNTRRCRNVSWQAFRTMRTLPQSYRSCQPYSRRLRKEKACGHLVVPTHFLFLDFGLCGINRRTLLIERLRGVWGDLKFPQFSLSENYLTSIG
jgi:hypothetical protein